MINCSMLPEVSSKNLLRSSEHRVMRKFYWMRLALGCCALLMLLVVSQAVGGAVYGEKAAVSQSVMLMEKTSGRVLYEQNAYQRRPMASTTKIMTALVVIEQGDLDREVAVDAKAVGIEGSSIYLSAGERLTIRQLLYGLMLQSGNDSAVALAIATAGSVESFAEMMNQKAEALGLTDTHFDNPHGLDSQTHYTTAYDLAVIACKAMQNNDFREIVGCQKISIPWKDHDYDRLLINKNKMLHMLDGATGIKTGYTKKSGRCLVSSCLRDGMEIICVVLNCPPMWEVSCNLLNEMFDHYLLKEILPAYGYLGEYNSGRGKCKLYVREGFSYPVTGEEDRLIAIRTEFLEGTPIADNQPLGKVKVYFDSELIYSGDLYAVEDLPGNETFMESLTRVLDHYLIFN